MNTNTDTEMKTDTSHYDKCRTLMLRHKKNHMHRVVITAVLMLINAYISIIRIPIIHGLVALYGFFFGIGVFLYCIVIVIIGFLAVPERPKLLVTTCILIIIGIFGKWISIYLGIAMLGLFLWQIPECKQALWIKDQPGYPHFNERFTEQMKNFGKTYQSEYQFDDFCDSRMPDMPETPSPDFVIKEMPSVPESIQNLPETEKISFPELLQDIIPEAEKSALEATQNIPETNDLGTDRILMKFPENNNI